MPYKLVYPYKSIVDTVEHGGIRLNYEGHLGKLAEIRVRYLDEYLAKLSAKTVIVEHQYIDRNFIEDYCGHYARCFNDYPKKCDRIHIFSNVFDEEDLKAAAIGKDQTKREAICNNYLGFIIIRPVPGAHFGKVCLRTYPHEEGKNRLFPILKKYEVHFLGLTLSVDTVAFQEQDNVISACATSALWSALHGIRGINPNAVSSPFQITRNARRVFIESPSTNVLEKGLFPSQMAAAITDEGYEPVLSGVVSKSYLKAVIRAYENVGLPVILGMTLAHEDEEYWRNVKHENPVLGQHAVTVTGYRLSQKSPVAFPYEILGDERAGYSNLYMLSSCIDELYVHDDQIGPFSSMLDRNEYWPRFETRWNYYIDPEDKVDATVQTLIIPCHKKIRIRYPLILSLVSRCNRIFGSLWKSMGKRIVWDAKLYSVNEFKENIADKIIYVSTDDELRFKILSQKLPRFMWVVDAYESEIVEDREVEASSEWVSNVFMTYLFDATDMGSSDYFLCGIHHTTTSFELVQKFIQLTNDSMIQNFIRQQTSDQLVLESLISSYLSGNTAKLLR